MEEVVVQSPSRIQLFVISWTAALQASLSLTHLPKSAQVYVNCIRDTILPGHPVTLCSPSTLKLS